ncbi:MAG: hypothetical protein HKN17_06945 [Rhodothermales bacterium]|nr:hypothetical protein [Rhodothermales bacterium]
MTISTVSDEFPYTIEISVQYVNPSNPSQASTSKTVAKEVTVTITSPLITIGGNPFEIKMSRVATYNRHMTAP